MLRSKTFSVVVYFWRINFLGEPMGIVLHETVATATQPCTWRTDVVPSSCDAGSSEIKVDFVKQTASRETMGNAKLRKS